MQRRYYKIKWGGCMKFWIKYNDINNFWLKADGFLWHHHVFTKEGYYLDGVLQVL